jgi:CrcB protein
MNSLFLVMAGGAVGAGLRHLVGRAALAIAGPDWPWATLTVNLVGGLAMGVLTGVLARATDGEFWRLLLGVGLLGGFTTFSAFSLDAVMMIQRGEVAGMLVYVALSVVGAISALAVGLTVARVIA